MTEPSLYLGVFHFEGTRPGSPRHTTGCSP
jgi:hypothetical protein